MILCLNYYYWNDDFQTPSFPLHFSWYSTLRKNCSFSPIHSYVKIGYFIKFFIIHLCLFWCSNIVILMARLGHLVPVSFLAWPPISWAHPYFLTQDIPGSSCIFPASGLELIFFPRNPGFFWASTVVRNHHLGAWHVQDVTMGEGFCFCVLSADSYEISVGVFLYICIMYVL